MIFTYASPPITAEYIRREYFNPALTLLNAYKRIGASKRMIAQMEWEVQLTEQLLACYEIREMKVK